MFPSNAAWRTGTSFLRNLSKAFYSHETITAFPMPHYLATQLLCAERNSHNTFKLTKPVVCLITPTSKHKDDWLLTPKPSISWFTAELSFVFTIAWMLSPVQCPLSPRALYQEQERLPDCQKLSLNPLSRPEHFFYTNCPEIVESSTHYSNFKT